MKPPTNSIFVYDNKITYKRIVAAWDNRVHRYVNFTVSKDTAFLRAVETPPVSEQLQSMVSQVQSALPGIFALTNRIAAVLDSTASATSNLNTTLVESRPMITNFVVISDQLREPGGFGIWALGTNGNDQVQGSLTNVDALLMHLADITSNLNAQVQANSNMLSGISRTVTDSDDFVQGLKRHWLLRSAFKSKATNAPPVKAK